jgi:hypothetical protein
MPEDSPIDGDQPRLEAALEDRQGEIESGRLRRPGLAYEADLRASAERGLSDSA